MSHDRDLLVQVSRLYYELGETQNEVADRLGLTRPQVSRLLKRARAEGVVEIRIIDRDAVVRQPLMARESLLADGGPCRADARRARGSDPTDRRPPRLAGPSIERPRRRHPRDRRRGLVSAVTDALEDAVTPIRATVVPLAGGYWSTSPDRDPFRRVADALGAQPHGLMAPGLLDDAGTKQALESHAGVRAVIDLWDRIDVALFGIGGPSWGVASLGPDVTHELSDGAAVGEVLDRAVRHRWPVPLSGPARAGARIRRSSAA